MKVDITKEIELIEGTSAVLDNKLLTIKGAKGEISKSFAHPKVTIKVEGNKIILNSTKATKREKTIVGSFFSHIKNMVKGANEPHVYKLKICSGHFPMNVSVSGQEIIIKNLFGEAVPRKVTFLQGASVKVDGTEIIVSSNDKELAGQTAAKIESACRINNRDIRIFQDGCYIVEKAGKKL